MTVERHTVHFKIDPALRAYCAWLETTEGREFDLNEYDAFAAGYRWRISEEPATPAPSGSTP